MIRQESRRNSRSSGREDRDRSSRGWASGPAQLGYGDGDEATVVSYGPDSGSKYITTYFRHTFGVADPGAKPQTAGTLLKLVRRFFGLKA